MRDKSFDEYSSAHLRTLRRVLAEVYSALGNISQDLYLVGGLVPDLLVKNKLTYLKEYLGTLDIDLAIKFAVSEEGKYKNLYKILRSAGFEKQKTPDGTDVINHSFIKYGSGYKPIIIDLITDDGFEPAADKLKEIAPDVDAVKFRGVYLVFNDFITREIGSDRKKIVQVKIPNIVPFLTLKAFAYSDGESRTAKDAFDMWYTIVNFKEGPVSVKEELSRYKNNKDVADAFKAIRRQFDNEASSGTKDIADILVKRYGLERVLANREIISPVRNLLSN